MWKQYNQELWLKKIETHHFEALRVFQNTIDNQYYVGWNDVQFRFWFGHDKDIALEEITENAKDFHEKKQMSEEDIAAYLVLGHSFWSSDEREVVTTKEEALSFLHKYHKDIVIEQIK